MTSVLVAKETTSQRLFRLKTQQQLCSKLLMDCVSLMAVYPDHTERLTSVMSQVENMMEQNCRLIASMESPS